jgi:GMP synthase-like glutamine amidotransferase
MTDAVRIAILDAVPKMYWHVDEGITDGEKFHQLLAGRNPEARIDTYYACENEFPEKTGDYDGYLITGSPVSVHDSYEWVTRLSTLIVEADRLNRRIIASCFGHQLVAKTFGGSVGRNEGGWVIGNYQLRITQRYDWMSPPRESTSLYHFNQERVTQLPPGARAFAHSDEYPDFAYTMGDNILCVQGHPEQPSRAMNNFLDSMIGTLSEEELQQARERIHAGEPDAGVWGQWMMRFLTGS